MKVAIYKSEHLWPSNLSNLKIGNFAITVGFFFCFLSLAFSTLCDPTIYCLITFPVFLQKLKQLEKTKNICYCSLLTPISCTRKKSFLLKTNPPFLEFRFQFWILNYVLMNWVKMLIGSDEKWVKWKFVRLFLILKSINPKFQKS